MTMHWHGDTFDLPPAGVRLGESDATPVQAFEAFDGRVLALQFHPELRAQDLEALLAGAADDLDGTDFVQSAEEIRAGMAEWGPLNEELLRRILTRMERVGTAAGS